MQSHSVFLRRFDWKWTTEEAIYLNIMTSDKTTVKDWAVELHVHVASDDILNETTILNSFHFVMSDFFDSLHMR